VATRNRFSVRGVFNIKKPTRATVLEHPRFRSLRLVIFFLLPINQLCPKLCGVSWFEKLMQTYLLGDEESAVWIQSSRWRFGLRRSATDSSLWLKNASKRLFTYIQNIVDRIFFEVPGKGRCPGCREKECLAIDLSQWTVVLLHNRLFVLHIRGFLHRRKPHGRGTRVRRSRSPAKHQAVVIIWNSSVVFPFGYLPAELSSVTMSLKSLSV
jgi:hypothetical protein